MVTGSITFPEYFKHELFLILEGHVEEVLRYIGLVCDL